ncbi:long-chain fatty acid--CoA ligase [Pseudaminobacter arsenicus]|uniref:Long-chain fatty acid--CoA ligase n=1 Tax=Borborobacter arsenicus TaxID=1851146 RepID=A0A432VB69_9HYPH|nr:AMP-binding protein [Pseudaminobacter arsenicus]RUM99410.1 long-chain fatty acid--CoA ligase [Pseudaminobacter arsenicus]
MQSTFPRLLLEHAAKRPGAPAMREKAYGIWQTTTWADMARMVEHLAHGLHEAGLRRGEHVVIIGDNRPRLYAAMLAAQALRAIPVPLYQDAVAEEWVFPINNADVRFAIVEDQEQVDKIFEISDRCPQLRNLYYDEPRGLRNYSSPGLASLTSLIEAGRSHARTHPDLFLSEVEKGQPSDVAAMFFTSGTTGVPKGVVHTYHALIDRAAVVTKFDKLNETDEVLAYLPPAWIGQNIFSYAQWLVAGYVVNCPEDASTIGIDFKEVGTTYYFAPPRVFEGMLTSVMIRMEDAGLIKRSLFSYFMGVASRVGPRKFDDKPVGTIDRLLYGIGNVLVYGPLRNMLGMSRIRVAYTAGEAIGPDLFSFYRSIGINLKQIYGSTETAVFVCLQPDHEVKMDTVGVPCEGVSIRLADNGEVLVRSPGMFKEYYKNPEATAEVLTADGWYHTNDAGLLDAAGHLKIIDRVKDVGRLKGGPYDGTMFAPKYVENKLKFFSYIKEAVAFGDQREKVCVMLNIDLEAVGNWAERRNIPYTGYSDLAQKPEVYALVRECIEKVNLDLSRDELLAGNQINRFLVLTKELDADDGELTRTNKVRRGFIGERYHELVDALYTGKPEQFISMQIKFEDGRTGTISANIRIDDVRTYTPAKVAA